MEKLKLLRKACGLFEQGRFDECQRQLDKCCDNDVSPQQWIIKNNHIVSKNYCQTCHTALKDKLKNLLCQVKGIPPSRNVLPVELTITFNHSLLLYNEYQRNADVDGIKTIIDSVNSSWLRVCRACDVPILDATIHEISNCFIKALSCSLGDADLRDPLFLLGCLQCICHVTCGNIAEADSMLDIIHKNIVLMNKNKNVHFKFIQNIQGCTGKVDSGHDYGSDIIQAAKVLYEVINSVNRNDFKGVSSLVKSIQLETSPLNFSVWYINMYSLYLDGHYSDIIGGVSSVVSCNNLSVRDRCLLNNLLACSLMKQNKLTTAIGLLRQCLQDDFSFLLPLYNLAIMYGLQGRLAPKLESLHLLTKALHQQKALTVEPNPTIILLANHRRNKQNIAVQNTIPNTPSSLFVYYKLARSCLESVRFSDAADHYIDVLSVLSDATCVSKVNISENKLPSLVTIYYEAAFAQSKAGRVKDALLVIKELHEKLPNPPTYCNTANHASSNEKEFAEENSAEGDYVFPGKKRQRAMSDMHLESDTVDADVNENFYSYVNIALLKVFCLVRNNQIEGALQTVNSVLELLGECQILGMYEVPHSSKKIKLDQGDIHSDILHDSCHPILRMKAEAYNNKAIILIGQNKLPDANELLLNSIHCCKDFVDAIYNHTLLLIKLQDISAASANWVQFRFPEVALNTEMVSHLLAKNASSLKNAKEEKSAFSSSEGIPNSRLLMMDKFTLEYRMKSAAKLPAQK